MVETGLDILLREHVSELLGLRVGVLANQASVTAGGEHIRDALARSKAKITALFSPEHGIKGTAAAGEHVGDSRDETLDVPVFSLYARTRVPSDESLDLIDVMVVDLQDVGARFYTFASTLANVMTACGERPIPVWVLDRPNPISGLYPEGPVLEPEFASFVGMFPIPIRHSLTVGELAGLFVAHFGLKCELRIVPMRGWRRGMFWNETGLRWVMPSPSMPQSDTPLYYPGTCLLEGTNVSEGRGSGQPFRIVGASWVDGRKLSGVLAEYDLPGLAALPVNWTRDGVVHSGISISASDRRGFRPVLTGVAILCALRKLYPDKLEFLGPGADGRRHFDLLAGTASVREGVQSGRSPWDIALEWEPGVARFTQTVSGDLRYDD